MQIPPQLERLAAAQDGLVRRTQALAFLSEGRLARLIGPEGRWQVVLPAHYATFKGALTQRQQLLAAQMYAGENAVITGNAACAAYAFQRCPPGDVIDVLIHQTQKRQSHGFVRVERTLWLPEPGRIVNGVKFAPIPRAIIDACRRSRDLDEVRALLVEAVRRRRVPIQRLQRQLDVAPIAWSARPRIALKEIGAGAESVSECDWVAALEPSEVLPFVHYNCTLLTPAGAFLMRPDAYVEDVGLAGEVQSLAHHSLPEEQEADMDRRIAAGGYGIHVIEFRPTRIRTQPERVRADFEANYLARKAQGVRAHVTVVCHEGCLARRSG
jgi:hypothetical protein